MAYNRKMRKFEGTCYIPGEQLAMMAKYYRGANLNLNLTLFEDDFATMQETLDQACWCSKLDEVDRMKMAHMKGNEWRIQHDHCLQNSGHKPGGVNPVTLPALPQKSKSTVGKVERATSALSFHERGRVPGRGREDHRDDYYDRYRRDDYYDVRNRRQEHLQRRNHRVHYDEPYHRDDYYSPLDVRQNSECRNVGGFSDRRYEIESEAVISSLPEVKDIKCAVCNVETCFICKNHLYSPICKCKCRVANAGLCTKCNPCEEEEKEEEPQVNREPQVVTENRCNNTVDISTVMLTMMMNSMFKQSQTPELMCCCKPSRDNSDKSSSESSDGKVHNVFLYECEAPPKNNKKPKRRSRKATSSSGSSSCNCCKCSGKRKNELGKKRKGRRTDDGENDQKRKSAQGKGSKEGKHSNRKSNRDDTNSDTEVEQRGSQNNATESTSEKGKSSKIREEEDPQSSNDANSNDFNTKPFNKKSNIAGKSNRGGSKPHDSRNVKFFPTGQTPRPKNSDSNSLDDPGEESRRMSPRKVKPKPEVQKSDTQANVPDWADEESSTSLNVKEFIFCLPKIQSNLENLLTKLDQINALNNRLQGPFVKTTGDNQICESEFQNRPDIPMISSPSVTLNSVSGKCRDKVTMNCESENQESDTNIKYAPSNLPDAPPSISLSGSSKEGPNVPQPLNQPGYQPTMNASKIEDNPSLKLNTTPDGRRVAPATEPVMNLTQPGSTIEFSCPKGNNPTKHFLGCSNLSLQKDPSLNLGLTRPLAFIENHTASNVMQGRPVHQNAGNSNLLFSGGFPDREIIELPSLDSSGSPSNTVRKQPKIPNPGIASKGQDGDTIFQSCKQESLPEVSDPDVTDYASFTEEKYFLPPQTASMRCSCKGSKIDTNQEDQCYAASKRPKKYLDERATQKSRSKTLITTKFKAKQKGPLVLGKLIQGCTVRQNTKFLGIRGERVDRHDYSQIEPGTHLEQGVGPGKFRRSKSDSSLDHEIGDRSVENCGIETPVPSPGSAGKNKGVVPLKIHTGNDQKNCSQLSPKMRLGKPRNIPDSQTDLSDPIFILSDAYVSRQTGSQNYTVSSVKLNAISNDGSSTEILKMVQGMASSSRTNETELPQTTAFNSEFDIVPLIPLSSTPCSESTCRNRSGSVIEEHISDEVSPNTPAFLRKSRIQVEQLKRAHETIRSMIKNVNDVIAHIDSDSKIGIKSKTGGEDKERRSYFVHFDDEKSREETLDSKIAGKMGECECVEKPASFRYEKDQEQDMFAPVNRAIHSALTPSELNSSAQVLRGSSETTSRAHRDFFVLNSESTSTAFTESLRRSLENDTSRSVPICLGDTNERPRSTRPLKRRSWFPPPK